MTIKCWASELGGCSTTQSREHYITRALWPDGGITIRGFEWLDGRAKTVGVDSLTAKILCDKHNNLLSPLDAEASRVFRTVGEIFLLNEARGKTKLSKQYWKVQKYEASGKIFERWAAKYLVGLFCVVGKDTCWHETQTEPIRPPLRIVRAIFGEIGFEKPIGLYLAAISGDSFDGVDGVTMSPLFHPEGGLLGGHFEFKGFSFVIWLSEEDPHSFTMAGRPGTQFGPGANELLYRPQTWQFTSRHIITARISFDW
ncbi:MAG: hypothetical protein ACXWID_20045 [Pyrinomonadaceae bacterium]